MYHIYLGTRSGVYRLDGDQLTCLGLEQHSFEAIYALDVPGDSSTILAGSYGEGMFRSEDGGATWLPANLGLTVPALRTFMASPTGDGAILCGGEPGRGFRSIDHGRSWQEMAGIAAIPTSTEWYLPYSPRAGALRNFYVPPRRLDHLYASIEVGGLLFSPDGGESWTMLETFDDDIHHVTGHPERPDEVWLALGWAGLHGRPDADSTRFGGVARSDDGGQTWTKLIERDYTRAVLVPPARPDLVLAGPAKAVGRLGRIVVSSDGGERWEPAGEGIEQPMADMVELFVAAPDGSIWAICSGGRLLRAEPSAWHWRDMLAPTESAPHVLAVSFVTTS